LVPGIGLPDDNAHFQQHGQVVESVGGKFIVAANRFGLTAFEGQN